MRAAPTELSRLSAAEAARRIAAGELTSEALVRSCLGRIRERERFVRAWVRLDAAAARRCARARDAGPRGGLLHGVPVGIKDLIDTADLPTGYGSPIYAGYRPAVDAVCVALARAAGAVPVGKTVTTEFATFHPGKTANPLDLRHTPGGSSSGSAAAVADGMVPVAFGTQTAGSVIRPAAYCGVVGYKPSFGLISRVGVKLISDTLDTIGTLARTVGDAALLAAAAGGRPDLLVCAKPPLPRRVGVCPTHEWREARPETMAALAAAAGALARAGVKTRRVRLPSAYAGLARAQTEIMLHELARCLSYERLAHWDQLSPRLKASIRDGLAVTSARYQSDLELAARCRRALEEAFAGCDVLLAPSAPGVAPRGLASTGDPIFCRMWTLLGVPCVTIPCGRGPGGLPVGLQVVGRPGADAATLAAADALHRLLA